MRSSRREEAGTDAKQPPATDRAILNDVHRRLVQIHAALAERTNRELPDVMPWTLGELMALIRIARPAGAGSESYVESLIDSDYGHGQTEGR